MGFLPDWEIQKLSEAIIRPLITPLNLANIGPVSINLGIGRSFSSPTSLVVERYIPNINIIADDLNGHDIVIPEDWLDNGYLARVILEPGQVVLCHSIETINMPDDLIGLLAVRSSFARKWLDHSAANMIMPGFRGTICYELKNNNICRFQLTLRDCPVQVAFCTINGVPDQVYSGKYQDQNGKLGD